jgi:hypothetical protein
MKKAGGKSKAARARRTTENATDRITYRELRNTPGQVWEKLAEDRPLTLYAEGEAKALLIPIPDGDAATAREAYLRGRAMLAMRRAQDAARQAGRKAMSLDEINRIIREVRRTLRDSGEQ